MVNETKLGLKSSFYQYFLSFVKILGRICQEDKYGVCRFCRG